MFAEEEWTDSVAVNDQAHSVVKDELLSVKHKSISRHCLKRTLQTLGSAPDWEFIKPSVGSDEETEEAPVHLSKKKKQRCKKQKKTSGAGIVGDMGKETVVLQKPTKKQQVKPKVDTANTEKNSKNLHKPVEDSDDKRLSRRQWKNKIKNRKRCKNKFLLNSAAVTDLKLEEDVREAQVFTTTEKMQDVDDSSLFRIASVEKNHNAALNTNTHKKAHTVTKKGNKDTHQLTPSKPVSDGLKTNAHNQCEKQRHGKVDKKSWLQAKKLRSLLNVPSTESDEKLSDPNLVQEKELLEKDDGQMDRSSALRSRMEKRLESARFRYINELLYTSTSGEAKRMFKQDPDAIRIYHKGYTEQVKHWPANPVDSIISYIRQRLSSLVIADFGCGDCKIAQSVKNKVHCFDLAPVCDLVTACDMANVPLGDSTVDIAVFCLSLMGTNLADFLAEANRVLVLGGVLKIAEVASRFDNLRQFIGALSNLGFKIVSKDTDNSYFYSFEFQKTHNVPKDVKKIRIELKPCLYKKR